ncbi:JmjC domain protein, partial [Ancylostoma caninum]
MRVTVALVKGIFDSEIRRIVPKADEFSVDDVLRLVGGDRMIEVVEVSGQTSVKMTLKDFIDYYKTPREERSTLYNVLSLEFSNTEMEDIIQSPALVRQVDWVDNHWPDALRQRYITFNRKGHYTLHHTYPKVQNYCLMSVERCYTDFHVDFGGTSVWYHVLKGQKIFWMVEPSPTNIRLYEEFVKNPEQTGFFGNVVDKCCRVVLNPGTTTIIPSGWIHAVYTPSDSLVFGGNFLHSLRSEMQIQVYLSENRINITKKFRFPYIEELMLYVIADFVFKCTGRRYVRPARLDNARFDYVGKIWKQKGNHRKVINYQEYMSGGIQLEPKDLVAVDNQSDIQDNGVVNVIAMHAENTLLYNTAAAVTAASTQKAQAADENIEVEEESSDEKTEQQAAGEASAPPPHQTDPTIFYHEASIFHDLYGRSTSDHRNPIGEEPPIEYNQAELDRVSHLLLPEYERLCEYLRKKRLLDVAEGITQPASLLNCFHCILEKRRQQLVEMNLLPAVSPNEKKPKRTYRRQSQDTPKTPRSAKSRQNSGAKRSMSEEEHQNATEESHIDGTMAAAGDNEENVKMEEDTVKEEEPLEDAEIKQEGDEELEDENKPSTSSRKRELDEDYEEADAQAEADDDDDEDYEEKVTEQICLGTPKSSKKKHDPKKDKPMFVGGLPMAAIQEGPVVPNAYNYDPMAEIMKLGTGQLQSAYRKSKMNISLPKEKKIYKLEPKHHEEEGASSSTEKEKKPEPPRPPVISPLSINTRRLSDGAPARPSPNSGGPSPRVGFMPRLHDISPSTASGPTKSPLTSPAPRRLQTTSVDGLQRSPAEFNPAVNRASRGSFSEFGRTGAGGQISPSPRNGTPQPPPHLHPPPIPPLISSRPPPPGKAQTSPSDPTQRDEAQRGLVRTPQDARKARFADNPVSDVSPPPVSTTPPLMPSPAQVLRSPDLPPVFTPSTTTT